MKTLKEIKERQRKEIEDFVKTCPHTEVLIEDCEPGFRRREITIRCERCRLNLLTYIIDGSMSYLAYVRDCVNGHPDSRPSVNQSCDRIIHYLGGTYHCLRDMGHEPDHHLFELPDVDTEKDINNWQV